MNRECCDVVRGKRPCLLERELVSSVVPIYGMCECLSGWDMTGVGGSVGGAEGLRRRAGAHQLHMPVVQTSQFDERVYIVMRQLGWGALDGAVVSLPDENCRHHPGLAFC